MASYGTVRCACLCAGVGLGDVFPVFADSTNVESREGQRMRTLLIGMILLLSGCAHGISDKVFSEVHEGDSADKVQQLLGEPDSFGASSRIAGADAWYYKRGGDMCAFTVHQNIVKYRACVKDPSYVSPGRGALAGIGAGLQGMGQGLQRSRSVNCTSNAYGATTYTNCN